MKYVNLLFDGGIDEVRRILVRHIKARMRKRGLTPSIVDKILSLGKTLPKSEVVLPTCDEVLSDPSKLTGLMLSLFECLELETEEALGIEWRVEERMTPDQILEASEYCRGMWGGDEPTDAQRFRSACLAVSVSIVTEL